MYNIKLFQLEGKQIILCMYLMFLIIKNVKIKTYKFKTLNIDKDLHSI